MQLVFIIGTASIKIAEVIIGNIGKARGKMKKLNIYLCLKIERNFDDEVRLFEQAEQFLKIVLNND